MKWMAMFAAAAAFVVLGEPAGAQQDRPPATGSGLRYEYHGAVGVYRFVPVCPACSMGRYRLVGRDGAAPDEKTPSSPVGPTAPSGASSLTPFASPEGALAAGRSGDAWGKASQSAPVYVLHEPGGTGAEMAPGPGSGQEQPVARSWNRGVAKGPGEAETTIRYRGDPVIRYDGGPRTWRVGPGFLIEGG